MPASASDRELPPVTSSSPARTRFRVSGMDCASCAAKITTAVRRLPGVHDVDVSVTAGTATVLHDERASPTAIVHQMNALGYTAEEDRRDATPVVTADPNATGAAHLVGQTCGDGNLEHTQSHDGGHRQEHYDHGHGREHRTDRGLHGHTHDHGPSQGPWWRSSRGLVTIACGAALAVAYVAGKLLPAIDRYAFLAAMLVGLVPIARRAFVAARFGTPFSIEMLMTVAAVGAVLIGATEEAATVVFLFLVGELLEGVAAGRARKSIQDLTTLVPKTALLESDGGQTREVPAETLAVGSVILVRPGDRIPADGEIVSGESAIDEAPVTGESTPKRKGAGDTVFAGTISTDGALRIRVSATAADNTIARVVRLVEEAQESKAPTERFIDRFSRYYTPGVVAAGAAIAFVPPLLFGGAWSEWIYKGLAILLIGCPCALVISTPAAIAAGLSAGARRGLLLKGGAVLESLGKITRVAFDKTGTLTEGRPKVTDVIAYERSERDVLELAAALEAGSNHPLAKAILDRAQQSRIARKAASDVTAIGGKGVAGKLDGVELFLGSPRAATEQVAVSADQSARASALNDEGKTVSVLLAGGRVVGLIAMRDEPRADAQAGITTLTRAGIGTLMLTGDNGRTANAIAGQLGVEVQAELLPQDKQRIVRELQAKGERVAKVGDGINDAPALAAADVGIAMGGGTDIALETSDAAILHGRVADVAAMVALSRRVMANIHQNITLALGLKAVFLVTTVAGVTGLWPAILADTGATVLVTVNALRLLGFRPAQHLK